MVLAAVLTLVVPPAVRAQPHRGLTAAPELARIYDAIFDARFEDVAPLVAAARGAAPPEACQVLEAVAAWWRIQLDPHDTSRDAEFRARAAAAIAATTAWTEREPERAEAWFYLAGAHSALAQWRVARGERLAAARDGRRIKEALERAVALDAEMADAYFGLGLYRYYAAVAPFAFRMLRWILLLPGGDRVQGLQDMLRARQSGALVRSEADFQLHLVYLWYEQQPERALDLLRALRSRHPRNPRFRQAIAEIHDVYFHDAEASRASWQALLDAAIRGEVAEPAMARAAARLGLALQLDRLSRTDAALEHLRAIVLARPHAPVGVVARAHLQIGQMLDRAGRRAAAAAAYREAIAAAGADDPLKVTPRARAALRAPRR